MEFEWSAAQRAYRDEVKSVVAANLPADWWSDYAKDGPFSARRMAFARGFTKQLAAHNLVARHWPVEYGGQDSEPWEHIILSEEMWGEGEPRSSLYLGSNWAGPAIMLFGTEEQKQLHLNNIAQGKVLWCQGFSEPEAGSDLASLRTRAERDGDGYIINGRKIWTSYAAHADWIFLLARMDGAGRNGVTVFLLPMDTPGITPIPIKALQSADEFNETVFDKVRVPASARLGEEGKGWDIVTAALHHERVGQASYELARRALERGVEILKSRGEFTDPLIRARAASCAALCEAARMLVYKVIDERVKHAPQTALTSIARYAMVQSIHAVANFTASFIPDALTDEGDGRLQWAYKYGVTSGIAAGAAEIQLNLISSRFLELPKDA